MFQQDIQRFAPNVLHKTPEGYLTGKICVTGAGVFRYLGDDRKFVGRLRDRDQVKAATDSINCKPVTLQHPNQPVNLDNVGDLQVGMSANDASFDGLNNFVTITVTDKKAVEAIEKGEVKAISMGYKCNIVDNDGVWQGTHHDQEQRDIVYNHIALVKNGRAGDQVRFMVGDSADFADIFDIAVEETEQPPKADPKAVHDDDKNLNNPAFVNDNEGKGKNVTHNDNNKEQSMKTIQLDGVDYQADEKVIETLLAAQNDAAEKLNEIDTLLNGEGGIRELEAKVADLEGQLESANDEIDESVIDAAVNAKLEIMDAARAAGIECDVSDDVSDLKRQVVQAAFDGIDLESIEDEASLNALFASANGVIASRAEQQDGCDKGGKGGTKKNPAAQLDGAPHGSQDVADNAEDRLWKKMYNASNNIKKED